MNLSAFRLGDLTAKGGGTLDGSDIVITGAAGPDEAVEGDLTFARTNDQVTAIRSSKAAAAVVPLDFPAIDRPVVRHENPRYLFAQALALLAPEDAPAIGIHKTAVVAADARIGADVSIGPYVVVESGSIIGDGTTIASHAVIGARVAIGRNCRIDPHAVIYHDCTIGDRTTIFAGAIVGCDGFGFEVYRGRIHRMHHIGTTVIGNDVEVGAGTCVDRATTGETKVGDGTKIDNLVMIGHNCSIGRSTLIAGQTGIAGSTKIGNGVVIGGKCSIADHATIGDGAKIAGGAGIMKTVPPGAVYSGYIARDHRDYLREVVAVSRLPKMMKEFEALRDEVLSLRARFAKDQPPTDGAARG